MKILKAAMLAMMILLQLFWGNPLINAQSQGLPDTKVIMIIMNRADFKDFQQMPYVEALLETSYIGLMNGRASGTMTEQKAYATLGWGTRAEATASTAQFYLNDEEKGPVYTRRTGVVAQPDNIINLAIYRLVQMNLQSQYEAVPGILGQLLTDAGHKTAVIGNSDTDTAENRFAPLITMDQAGRTTMGQIDSNILIEDATSPYGLRTDYNKVFEYFMEYYEESSLLVVETGDLSRLDAYQSNLSETMYLEHRGQILSDIDQLVEKVYEAADEQTLLMLVTPFPTDQALGQGATLTPVCIHDKQNTAGGFLTSGTTRREGIIANVDIAPTVLNWLGLEPTRMIGRPMEPVAVDGAYEKLLQLNETVTNTSTQRYRVLYSFAVYEMLATVFALFLVIYRRKISKKWYQISALLLLANMTAPLVLLIMGLVKNTGITVTFLLLFSLTAGIVLVVYRRLIHQPLKAILVINGFMVLILCIDILAGQPLIKSSLLGYDPIIGARYYGLGNEYAGILLGSSLVFLGTALELKPSIKAYVPVFFAVLIMIMGLPMLGANVGGTITAIFSYLLIHLRIRNTRLNWKNLLVIGCAVMIGVAVFALIDLVLLEQESHLGNTLKQIYQSGFFIVPQIISRKIATNIRLMGVTYWSRVLLLALGTVGLLFYRPLGAIKRLISRYPELGKCWGGIVVACGVGFAVNDSGVVLAATAAILLSSSILYMILYDERIKGEYDAEDIRLRRRG